MGGGRWSVGLGWGGGVCIRVGEEEATVFWGGMMCFVCVEREGE